MKKKELLEVLQDINQNQKQILVRLNELELKVEQFRTIQGSPMTNPKYPPAYVPTPFDPRPIMWTTSTVTQQPTEETATHVRTK